MKLKENRYHFVAFLIVIIWGITFISTKFLLLSGLGPEDIFFYRFLLAYVGICFFGKSRLFARTVKDEFIFLLLGITGGSLYFLTENYALKHTFSSNVSLLVCVAPLLTALLSHCFLRNEKISKSLLQGILIAFTGVALVVFNGQFILKLNPVGDILSISAALCWAIYTLFLKKVGARYPTLFITRKIFFYGLLTILPVFLREPLVWDPSILFRPVVVANLLFLSIVASLLCYFFWNLTVKQLGAIQTTNYVYVIPVVTLIASYFFLNEHITVFAVVGTVFILSGLYWAMGVTARKSKH
jgi:drug/metabolite transporter (DMT)-like permease